MERDDTRRGFRRLPRIADQMTPDLEACYDHAIAAERAGDVVAALEWHRAVPMFRKGRHPQMLERLVRLGDDLPPWVMVRWLIYQATRAEDPDTATGELHRAVRQATVHSVHADQLSDCYERGGDPIKVSSRMLGESWAFHQLLVFEAGALECYVDELAAGSFLEHADLARDWARTPLGGWQVGDSLPGSRLLVSDAASGEIHEVLDLGARSAAGPDGWVVGRLVPSGVDERPVFDTPPLAVSERIAREVAAWEGPNHFHPIGDALTEGRLSSEAFMREDYELTTDVQELDLLRFGTPARELDRVMEQLRSGRDEVGRAAFRILERAARGEVDDRDAAYVAAAAVNPHAQDEAPRLLLAPSQADLWSRWAAMVPDPGRRPLEALARQCRAAA